MFPQLQHPAGPPHDGQAGRLRPGSVCPPRLADSDDHGGPHGHGQGDAGVPARGVRARREAEHRRGRVQLWSGEATAGADGSCFCCFFLVFWGVGGVGGHLIISEVQKNITIRKARTSRNSTAPPGDSDRN